MLDITWVRSTNMKSMKKNQAIEALFDDKNKLENLADNCRRYAESRFSTRNAEVIEGSYYE